MVVYVLWGARVVVPLQGRSKILTEQHEVHPGVKGFDKGQSNQSAPVEAPLHPWEWPGLPWSRIDIDYAGPYKGEVFLIVVRGCILGVVGSASHEVYHVYCHNRKVQRDVCYTCRTSNTR